MSKAEKKTDPVKELAALEKAEPPKPDKKKFEKKINDLKQEQSKVDRQIRELSLDIESQTGHRESARTVRQEYYQRFQDVKTLFDAAKAKRQALRAQIGQVRDGKSDLIGKKKFMGQKLGAFKTVAQIEGEIRRLENKIEMGGCKTLKEEKDILKDINNLKKKRADARKYEEANSAIDAYSASQNMEEVQAEIDRVNKELDGLRKRQDAAYEEFQKHKDESDAANDGVNESYTNKKDLNGKLIELRKQQTTAVKDFRFAQQERRRWEQKIERARREAQRYTKKLERDAKKAALEEEEAAASGSPAKSASPENGGGDEPTAEELAKKQEEAEKKKKQREERQRKQKEEYEAKMAEYEEQMKAYEEAQKVKDPNEGKKALCDRLLTYCSNFVETEQTTNSTAAKKNPQYKPKGDDDLKDYAQADGIFALGGTKKKKRKGKKKNKNKSKRLQHDVTLFSEFSELGIKVPLTADAVPKTIEEIKAKKADLEKKTEAFLEKVKSERAAAKAKAEEAAAAKPAEEPEPEAEPAKEEGADEAS